jgi:GMP reductase
MFKNIVAREYNYQDVYLRPAHTQVNSRKECNTSIQLGKHSFVMPVYPSNMKSVVSADTCEFLAKKGWFYTMHRFNVDTVEFVRYMQNNGLIASISIGVNDDTIAQLKQLQVAGLTPEFMTLDIANAWCPKAEKMIKYVKDHFDSFLIVGNIAGQQAAQEVHSWGADAIKAGIAGGRVCITKNKTGFHRPMVSTVLDCASYTLEAGVPLIADGGIVEHGDIAKAFACGAQMVMAGSLFAGYDQSAGNIIEVTLDGRSSPRSYKEYYGSASQYNKGEYKNVEGKKILIDYRGNMERLLVELQEDLQSSISYVGGTKTADLINAEIIVIN